jgi:hypothetical protein
LLLVLLIVGIAMGVWVQAQPLIDGGKASVIAINLVAGPDTSGWRADSATLDNSGIRSPRGNLAGFATQPKCWGTTLPIGDGYCLPYPVWRVHLIHQMSDGQCDYSLDVVDARRSVVAISLVTGPDPCGPFPADLAGSAQGPA